MYVSCMYYVITNIIYIIHTYPFAVYSSAIAVEETQYYVNKYLFGYQAVQMPRWLL